MYTVSSGYTRLTTAAKASRRCGVFSIYLGQTVLKLLQRAFALPITDRSQLNPRVPVVQLQSFNVFTPKDGLDYEVKHMAKTAKPGHNRIEGWIASFIQTAGNFE